MALNATKFQDCNILVKAFERGAAFSPTEESVFAMLTPILQASRSQMLGIQGQLDNTLNTTFKKPVSEKTKNTDDLAESNSQDSNNINLKNLDKSDEDDESMFQEIKGNFLGTSKNKAGLIPGGILNSDCIPCGERLNIAAELFTKEGLTGIGDNLKGQFMAYIESWITNIKNIVDQAISLFSGEDKYIDLCALIRWFLDFVCIPDFARMISAMMGLLVKIGFDFTGAFDLILGLVAPLLTPFLSNMLNTLMEYVMLVIRPIECIIDSIQAMIAKLDYNVLFENIASLDKHISFGRLQGDVVGQAGDKIPFVETNADLHSGPERKYELDYTTLPYISDSIKRENKLNQKEVDDARTTLQRIDKASQSLDVTNPQAVANHNKKKEEARQKYKDSVAKRDFSQIGRINQSLETVQNTIRSSIYTLVRILREAVETFEAYLTELFQEFQKLIGEFLGGSGSFLTNLAAKLEIVQMISLITSIISAIRSGCKEDDRDDTAVAEYISRATNAIVWTDNEGNVHIEDNEQNINNAIDNLVNVLGVNPDDSIKSNQSPSNKQNPRNFSDLDNESINPVYTSSQKLKSLINFTGDPVLDASISKTADALTTPTKVTFKCPLSATTSNAEKVNKWISELE